MWTPWFLWCMKQRRLGFGSIPGFVWGWWTPFLTEQFAYHYFSTVISVDASLLQTYKLSIYFTILWSYSLHTTNDLKIRSLKLTTVSKGKSFLKEKFIKITYFIGRNLKAVVFFLNECDNRTLKMPALHKIICPNTWDYEYDDISWLWICHISWQKGLGGYN